MSDELPGDPLPEERFTPPTALCPHPERWTSTDSDSTEVEVSALLAGLIVGLQPAYCVETGAAFGQTTEAIGEALQRNGHGQLDSIELNPDRAAYTRDRVAHLAAVTVVEGSSLDFTPRHPIAFAFFDSLYPLRVEEFWRYHDHMRAGTVVAFHDTAPGHGDWALGGDDLQGLIRAALGGIIIDVINLPTPRGLMIGTVR